MPPGATEQARHRRGVRGWLRQLGPGFITGAADDDPSGIATYAQAGAQFGTALLWTTLLSYPLMAAVQEICARVGRVTGRGVIGNLHGRLPKLATYALIAAVVVSNTVNIGADVAGMAAAAALVLPAGAEHLYALLLGGLCVVTQVLLPYRRFSNVMKWGALSVFAYVAVLLLVDVPWREVLAGLLPRVRFSPEYIAILVAVLGTTVSPYLFIWQSSQEVEELHDAQADPLKDAPRQARSEFGRIRLDTYVGMAVSNIVAFAIMLATAISLHGKGEAAARTITVQQAASALKPVAGAYAEWLFALGVIGTGLLAVPVLAGSAAYAWAEGMRWRRGMDLKPHEAKGFYLVIGISTAMGVAMSFVGIDPVKALVLSSALNGVVAVPLLYVLMRLATDSAVMGRFVLPPWLRFAGWLTSGLMLLAAAAWVWTLVRG